MNTPELFGVPVAVLALIVAGAGFIISAVALGWQVAKHLLDGGRVKVQLNAAAWEPDLVLHVNRTGRWAMNPDTQITGLDRIEVAQLVVENPGRTPVTIYSPGLAITGIGTKRHRISPRMFPLPNYASDAAVTDTVFRLDPYDRVTFILDYWSLIPSLREKAGDRHIVLRGVVEVAGKSRERKSPRRKAWRIAPDAWTSYRGLTEISPQTVMYRALYVSPWVNTDPEDGGISKGMLKHLLTIAMGRFQERPSRDEFQQALDDVAKRIHQNHLPLATAAWDMYEALDQHAGHLGPWTRKAPQKAAEPNSAIEDGDESTSTKAPPED